MVNIMPEEVKKEILSKLLEGFLKIFKIYSENWKLEKVKYLGKGDLAIENAEKFYRLIGIFSAKIDNCDTLIPTDNEMTMMKNRIQGREITGPDIIITVKWKEYKEKEEKRETKKFTYVCSLTPESIKSFRILGDICRIKAEMIGSFS